MPDRRRRSGQQANTANQPPRGALLVPSGQTDAQGRNPGNGTETGEHQPPRHQPQPDWPNILMVIFTALIAVVTCVYSYFSYGQWTSMDKSLEEVRKNRELEYRAYVAVRSVKLIPDPTRPGYGRLMVSYINTGRTPGTNGQIVKSVEARENTIPEDSGFSPADNPPGRTILAPSIEVESAVGYIVLKPDTVNTANDGKGVPVERIGKRQSASSPTPAPAPTPPPEPSSRSFYAWGIITYDDIFGRHHRTKFCFKNTPGTEAWGFCETYNSVE